MTDQNILLQENGYPNAPDIKALRTVTYDPAVYKLVPVEPTEEMHVAAVRTIVRCAGNDDFPPRVYAAMLTTVPDQLPGVVVHEDSPYAYVLVDQGQVAADDYVDFERVELASEITPDEVARFDKAGRLGALYLHPAPSQQIIESCKGEKS